MKNLPKTPNVIQNHIAIKSYAFWQVSQAYNKRPGASNVSVGDAITHLNGLHAVLGPHRKLVAHVTTLCDWIVTGKRAIQKQPQAVPNGS